MWQKLKIPSQNRGEIFEKLRQFHGKIRNNRDIVTVKIIYLNPMFSEKRSKTYPSQIQQPELKQRLSLN